MTTMTEPATTTPRSGRLGLVALILALVATVGGGIAAGSLAAIAASAQLAGDGTWMGMSGEAEVGALIAAGGALLALVVGLAALGLGIAAIVRRSRRTAGIVAVVLAVIAPGIAFAAFTVTALVYASGA